MNIRKYIQERHLVWAFCLAGLFASCVRDGGDPAVGPDSDRTTRVEILLHAPESEPSTRSLTAADEIRIENILVLFFKESDMQLHSVSEGRKLSPAAESGGRVLTFETSFSVETGLASQPFACIVLANVADRFDFDSRLSWRGKTYSQLRAELVQAVSDKLYTASPSSMAMWGRSDESLLPSQPRQRLSVPLLRSVARADVAVAEEVSNFILDEVYVYKPNSSVALLPALEAYDKTGRKVTKPSVPASAGPLGANWIYPVSDNRIDYSVYLPEADVILGGEGTPGDDNHLERCALVVGGRYPDAASPKSYYRIDFKQGGTDPSNTLMDVLRNHRFDITITQVLGRGEETPDQAYQARTAAITAEVVTWTDNNQDIVFDGANWASVECKRMDFGDGLGAEELLGLLSNVKPSQWSLQFALPDGSATCDETKNGTVSGRYFRVVKPADKDDDASEQGGYLTVRTLQALGEGRAALQEQLIVRIGKLELVVDLHQHPYSDTEWDDGGNIEGGF